MTERIGTIGKPLYHHWSARDYAGFSNSAFFYDGIENAGLGIHTDTLPVAYGQPQWKNLAPAATTFAHNTDLDVVGMTPAADGMAFTADGATWAGWGFSFNTSKVSYADATALLDSLFPADDISVTFEVVFSRKGSVPTSVSLHWLTGYNEHGLYGRYNSNIETCIRYPITKTDGTRGTIVRGYPADTNSDGSFSLAATLSSTTETLYMNGVQTTQYNNDNAFKFFTNMVGLLRVNSIDGNSGVTGKYFRVQITRGILTASEIAANYAIDKLRFGIP